MVTMNSYTRRKREGGMRMHNPLLVKSKESCIQDDFSFKTSVLIVQLFKHHYIKTLTIEAESTVTYLECIFDWTCLCLCMFFNEKQTRC